MAFKAKVVSLSSSDTIISQMDAGLEGAVHGLVFCNNNNEQRTLTLKLQDASEGVTSVFLVTTIAANSQFTWSKPINMEPGDAVIASGPDLIAIHSTYVGSAVPAASGFTGRGAWSSAANYVANDVVNHNGSSYLANGSNTDSEPPSANWTLLAAAGTDSSVASLIRKPTAVTPVTGGLNVPPNGPLTADGYGSVYSVNTRNYRRFEVTTTADTDFASPVFTVEVDADSTVISPPLDVESTYIWRCKDVSDEGDESPWMDTQTFTTLNLSVVTPTLTVEGGPSTVDQIPTLTTSAYATTPTNSATHTSTDWEIRKQSDNSLVFSSYANTVNKTQIVVPSGTLVANTTYVFRARHNSSLYGASGYGEATATTKAVFSDVVYSSVNVDDQRIVTHSRFNSVAVITATDSVHVYGVRNANTSQLEPFPIYAQLIRLIEGVPTEIGDPVLVTDNAYQQFNYDWSIAPVSSNNGVFVWTNYYEGAAGNQGFVWAKAFVVSGDTLSFGQQITVYQVGSTTERTYMPLVFRTSATQAVVTWKLQANQSMRAKVLTLNGDTVVAGTSASNLDNTDFFSSPEPYHGKATRFDRFLLSYRRGSSGSLYNRIAMYSLSGTGTSATVNGSEIASRQSGLATGDRRSAFDLLTNVNGVGKLVLFWYDNSNGYHVTTMNFTAAAISEVSNRIINQSSPGDDLLRLSDTTFIVKASNAIRGYTWTSDSSNGLTLTTITTPPNLQQYSYSAIQDLPSPSSPLYNYTNHFGNGAPTTGGFTLTKNNLSGFTFSYSNILPLIKTGINSALLYNNRTSVALSKTRVLELFMEDSTGSSTDSFTNGSVYDLRLALFDASGQQVVQLTEQLITRFGTGMAGLHPFTSNRVLVYNQNKLNLISVADNSITVLDTIDTPAAMNNQYVSFARIDDNRILLGYTASSHAWAVIVTRSGDTITVGTPVQCNITQDIQSAPMVACLSTTKGIIVYRRSFTASAHGSILNISGDTITISASDTLVTPYQTNASMQYFIQPLDSNRYVLCSPTASNTININIIQDDGSTLSYGSGRSLTLANTGSQGFHSFERLSSTRGVVIGLDGTSEPRSVSVYGLTFGAGTATPGVFSQLATVLSDVSNTNRYISSSLLTDIGNETNKNEVTLVFSETDARTTTPVGTLIRRMYKFLRGTA